MKSCACVFFISFEVVCRTLISRVRAPTSAYLCGQGLGLKDNPSPDPAQCGKPTALGTPFKFEWLLLTEVCTCEYIWPSRIGNLYSYGNMIYFYTLVYTINTHCYNFICVLACCTVQGKRCLTLIINIYVVFTIYIYIL